jgi:MoaA/NifB/PqqE/SkfB family radical SAM enzyme
MINIDGFGFQWHITDRCAGRCRHCYQSAFNGKSELPIDALTRIADHIMAAIDAPVSVNVTGGEPLLYQCGKDGVDNHIESLIDCGRRGDVFDLLSHLSTFDNLNELNIITSTHGMTERTIGRLKSIPKLTSVKVSLESHDPTVNDSIRKAGHFKTTVGNIAALVRSGLPVTIMATLSKQNYRSVEGLCRLSAGLGATGVIIERYVPLGRGSTMSSDVLTSSEWSEILSAIIRVAEMDVSVTDLLPYKAFRVDTPLGKIGGSCEVSGALCNLGPSSMALMPDGTVYPCRRVPAPVGKLPDDKMERILEKLNAHSPTPQRCFDFDF